MDRWKYFDLGHRDHEVLNPTSDAKLDELIGLLELPADGRVLDVGCGKAEPLVRIALRHRVRGVGVDLSPPFVRAARERVARRLPVGTLEILELDGARYSGEPESFDLAMCLGASWIWGGYRGTLQALARFTRPGALVLVGEPFWLREPAPGYLQATGMKRDAFADHAGNVAIGLEEGLIPLFAQVSDAHDFDRYEGLQWRAIERHAASHPEDPDLPWILRWCRSQRDAYLRWGRETLGWAMYLFARQRA